MDLDDEVCLCFHVTKRKVLNYLRVERPKRESQLADCFGAGTGCGWCRTLLSRYFAAAQTGTLDFQTGNTKAITQGTSQGDGSLDPSSSDYSRGRSQYVREGHGTPPAGATPIGDA